MRGCPRPRRRQPMGRGVTWPTAAHPRLLVTTGPPAVRVVRLPGQTGWGGAGELGAPAKPLVADRQPSLVCPTVPASPSVEPNRLPAFPPAPPPSLPRCVYRCVTCATPFAGDVLAPAPAAGPDSLGPFPSVEWNAIPATPQPPSPVCAVHATPPRSFWGAWRYTSPRWTGGGGVPTPLHSLSPGAERWTVQYATRLSVSACPRLCTGLVAGGPLVFLSRRGGFAWMVGGASRWLECHAPWRLGRQVAVTDVPRVTGQGGGGGVRVGGGGM